MERPPSETDADDLLADDRRRDQGALLVCVGALPRSAVRAVKKYRSRREGFHSWSEDEIARFEKRHE